MAQVFFDDEHKIKVPGDAAIDTFDPAKHVYSFSTAGNIKMGKILSWSTLMSDYTVEGLPGALADSTGTCGNCDGCVANCYVRASYRFPGVIRSHAINTYGLRHQLGKVEADLASQLKRSSIDVVRINQSGELENDEQMAMWCRLATAFPGKRFYIYTKMFDIATKALLAGKVPENFTVLFSVWHECGVAEYEAVKHLKNVKAFMYDDGVTELSTRTYCMAYDEHGHLDHTHTCESCKLCFNSRAKVIGCHAH